MFKCFLKSEFGVFCSEYDKKWVDDELVFLRRAKNPELGIL